MRRRRRMSASARATVRRWARLSLHGASVVDVPAAGVAALCPPPLHPAAANASAATTSAKVDERTRDTGTTLTGDLADRVMRSGPSERCVEPGSGEGEKWGDE